MDLQHSHSPNMGGIGERLRSCKSILAEATHETLTHDVLSIFMTEVCAIINNWLLVYVSTCPENPFILSPATILTQKIGVDHVEDSFGELDTKDLLKTEGKRVSTLSDYFYLFIHVFFIVERKTICIHSKNAENGAGLCYWKTEVFAVHNGHMELRVIQSEDDKVQKVENHFVCFLFLVLRGHFFLWNFKFQFL